MYGLLDACDRPAEIDFARVVVQVIDGGVGDIIRTENLFGLNRFVGFPTVGDSHCGKDHAFLVTQGNVLTDFQAFGEFFADVQRDRDWPQGTVSSAHVFHDTVVIRFGQKAFERVEAAVHQQFKVTDLTRGQIPAGQVGGLHLEFLGRVVRNIKLGNRGKIGRGHMRTFVISNAGRGRPPGCTRLLDRVLR